MKSARNYDKIFLVLILTQGIAHGILGTRTGKAVHFQGWRNRSRRVFLELQQRHGPYAMALLHERKRK